MRYSKEPRDIKETGDLNMTYLTPRTALTFIVHAGVIALTSSTESTACFAGQSLAQDFFKSLDQKHLENIGINEAARSKIIQSGFEKGIEACDKKDEDSDPWYISRATQTQLELKECSNLEEVLFRIYKSTSTQSIGLAAFIGGNHQQTQYLHFFKISQNHKPQPVLAATLGLKSATENDFLDYRQRFSSKDNHQVPFFVEPENETIQASPWIWMDPRWESKTIKWEIRYFWNGTRFEKNKILIATPEK